MSAILNHDRQRRSALVDANEIRFRNRDVKQYLGTLTRTAASLEAAEMLRRCPVAVTRMRLHEFLEAIPGVGDERIRRVCQKTPSVWPFRRIGDLTSAERERLAQRITLNAGWGETVRDGGRNDG